MLSALLIFMCSRGWCCSQWTCLANFYTSSPLFYHYYYYPQIHHQIFFQLLNLDLLKIKWRCSHWKKNSKTKIEKFMNLRWGFFPKLLLFLVYCILLFSSVMFAKDFISIFSLLYILTLYVMLLDIYKWHIIHIITLLSRAVGSAHKASSVYGTLH